MTTEGIVKVTDFGLARARLRVQLPAEIRPGPGMEPELTRDPQPVRIILPFAPGGSTDLQARLLAKKYTESLGQAFVVENGDSSISLVFRR